MILPALLSAVLAASPACAAPADLDAVGVEYVSGSLLWLSGSKILALDQKQVEAILRDIELNPPYFPKEGQRAEFFADQIGDARGVIEALDSQLAAIGEACAQAADQAACAGAVAARNQKITARIGALERFSAALERQRAEELAHPTPGIVR